MSVAQLVEHWSPKPGVRGSSPLRRANGSMAQRQLHLTVNQASLEFVGSSPTAPTKLSSRITAVHLVLVQRIEVRILGGQQLVLWCNG